MNDRPPVSRRDLLRSAAALAGAGPLARLHQVLAAKPAVRQDRARRRSYGRLRPTRDATTGLPLVELPEGFRYLSFGWTKDPLADGAPTPGRHDGMGAFAGTDGHVVLVRNHEATAAGARFSEACAGYDASGGTGGTTTLRFDPTRERLVEARASLTGTLWNCSGGPTPWNSWLSCEETLAGPGDHPALTRSHGWVFEVPAEGEATGRPLTGMGRFFHEAAVVDADAGDVYLTEDRHTSGLYRFRPEVPGELAKGGRLAMLRVPDHPHLSTNTGQLPGRAYPVDWVPIEDPTRAHDQPGDCLGVFAQGRRQGGTSFARLEGATWRPGELLFVATSGGDKRAGQVWRLDLSRQTLSLVFESPGHAVLSGPDNLTVSPRGGVVLCEDGGGRPLCLQALTPWGEVEPFARNHMQLEGEVHGWRGDFRRQEFSGACFSPDGRWLFANIQTPGVTLAITGPWERGVL